MDNVKSTTDGKSSSKYPSLKTINTKSKSKGEARQTINFGIIPNLEKCVIYEHTDVTPLKLYSPKYECLEGKQDFPYWEITSGGGKSRSTHSTLMSEDKLNKNKSRASSTSYAGLDKIAILSSQSSEEIIECEENEGGSEDNMEPNKTMPEEINVVLEETETIYLFEMPSVTVPKGTEEAELVEKENEKYVYLTIGKGRNRKTINTESQTIDCIMKTRQTLAPTVKNKSNYAFASAWDMFDSYNVSDNAKLSKVKEKIISEDDTPPKGRRNTIFEIDHPDELQVLAQCPRFFDAAIVMERVLANNTYKRQQKLYKGLLECLHTNGEEHHTSMLQLELLWTYQCVDTINISVTSMCANHHNNDIFAVGYGKFNYSDKNKGVICIWTIKNPTQPERIYPFCTPITSLAFSKRNPNLVAAGFSNGDVIILDITLKNNNIVSRSSRETSPTFEPVWQLSWFSSDNFHSDIEQVVAIGNDGRINKYLQLKTNEFACQQMMRMTYSEINIRQDDGDNDSNTNNIPILRNPPCLVFCPHPTQPDIYFVGTSDGKIYKCTTNFTEQHVSVFRAHNGPVYCMEYSHFCNKIFLTCGADWTVKIWVEDVLEPLIVFSTLTYPILGAAFCPLHSTIIASISGTDVYLWDLKQKTDMLACKTSLPQDLKKLTILQFTNDGKNIILSDVKGGVHVHSLIGLAEPPGDQCEVLETSLTKALTIKPELLKKFEKVLSSKTN